MSGGFLGFMVSAIFNGLGGWPKIIQSLAISILSAGGAFVVTLLVSPIKAPAIRHKQQHAKISEMIEENARMAAVLAEQHEKLITPKRSASEERKYVEAKAALDEIGSGAK